MPDLTFYTNPMSRGRMVRFMLEELGQPYETKIVNYGAEMRTPEYLALNPMAKVPTVVHGDTVITECAAICAYLAEAFPDSGLAPPAGSPEKGTFLRWMFYAAGPVEAAVLNRSLGVKIEGHEMRGRAGYGDFGSVMDTLEGLLADGREWLMGETFTALDVYLGSHLNWGLAFDTMDVRPGFDAYVQRLRARPAAVRATELDDALVPRDG